MPISRSNLSGGNNHEHRVCYFQASKAIVNNVADINGLVSICIIICIALYLLSSLALSSAYSYIVVALSNIHRQDVQCKGK